MKFSKNIQKFQTILSIPNSGSNFHIHFRIHFKHFSIIFKFTNIGIIFPTNRSTCNSLKCYIPTGPPSWIPLAMRVKEVGRLDVCILCALSVCSQCTPSRHTGGQVRERGARGLESPLCCFPNRWGGQEAGVFVSLYPLDHLVWVTLLQWGKRPWYIERQMDHSYHYL